MSPVRLFAFFSLLASVVAAQPARPPNILVVLAVDHALRFLGEAREAGQPWFLYVAFNAPHAPLQPLEADYRRYLGKYDGGWDTVRAARVAKQKQIGLLPAE